jgi:hypothetical protein
MTCRFVNHYQLIFECIKQHLDKIISQSVIGGHRQKKREDEGKQQNSMASISHQELPQAKLQTLNELLQKPSNSRDVPLGVTMPDDDG